MKDILINNIVGHKKEYVELFNFPFVATPFYKNEW
jgi:hypothetical protein